MVLLCFHIYNRPRRGRCGFRVPSELQRLGHELPFLNMITSIYIGNSVVILFILCCLRRTTLYMNSKALFDLRVFVLFVTSRRKAPNCYRMKMPDHFFFTCEESQGVFYSYRKCLSGIHLLCAKRQKRPA